MRGSFVLNEICGNSICLIEHIIAVFIRMAVRDNNISVQVIFSIFPNDKNISFLQHPRIAILFCEILDNPFRSRQNLSMRKKMFPVVVALIFLRSLERKFPKSHLRNDKHV